jgi:hypothetical protein
VIPLVRNRTLTLIEREDDTRRCLGCLFYHNFFLNYLVAMTPSFDSFLADYHPFDKLAVLNEGQKD